MKNVNSLLLLSLLSGIAAGKGDVLARIAPVSYYKSGPSSKKKKEKVHNEELMSAAELKRQRKAERNKLVKVG